MTREQTVHKSDLVRKEDTKTQTHEPGKHAYASIPADKVFPRISKRHRNRCCNQHHPRHSTRSEDQQVGDRGVGIADRRQNQKRHSS